MKTTRKNLFLVVLSALFAIFLFGGIGVKVAFAETATLSSVELTMDKGASVRKNEPTGLRFTSVMSVSDYNALTSNVGEGKEYSSISFGMLIAPQDYIAVHGELSYENVFGENAEYSFDDGESDKPKIINVYAPTMKDYGGNKAFSGIITNVKPANYNREFVGVGYIKATAQDGTVTYKFANANDNARSVISVAQKAIAAGETDENGVLADFTKFADLGGIVSSVANGDKTKTNAVNYQTGEISVTATSANMDLSLSGQIITKNGKGCYSLRLYVKSSTPGGTAFRIMTKNTSGVQNAAYLYKTLGSEGIIIDSGKVSAYADIPLNDTTVHDFSKYDLTLRAEGSGQNITIAKIEYISLEKELKKSFYSSAIWSINGEEKDDSITFNCKEVTISAEWIKSAIAAGYTHCKFNYVLNGGDCVVLMHGGTWNKYWRQCGVSDTLRIDLSEFKDTDGTYYGFKLENRLSGNATDGQLTLSSLELYKSEETAKWTKSNSSIYCAEEDGFIVIDTRQSGNFAHVLSTTEWWAKYANNSATGSVSQRTIMLSGKYLNEGSNYRGAIWGNKGSALSSVGTTANTEIVTEYLNDTTYAEGNKFYYGLESEGVYALNVNEFVSDRNSHGGFAYTYIDENTFTVTLTVTTDSEGKKTGNHLVNVNTQDYIAKGYTQVVISLGEYTGNGTIWVGNNTWGDGGYMYGLKSGGSQILDLTKFTTDNPYLHIYCPDETTTVTITYRFF